MRICLFHPRLLPPKDYGGVERVVLWLAKGLQELGHEVHVAASAGSRLPPGSRLIAMDPKKASAHDLLGLLPPGLDVVHFMAPPEEGAWERLPCAGILTVHGNGKPGERFPLNTVFLSRDHARRHGAEAFIHNGIDPGEYRFDPKAAKERWALFLSKTSWRVKNVAGAQAMCRRAGLPLWIAGGRRPWSTRLQTMASPGMRWVGPVGGARKAELLARARCLVFPILWPEPFGLVVAEALMSGTPVIASRLGSLPELIGPEVGELLDPPVDAAASERWVDRLRELVSGERGSGRARSAGWDAERCRLWAEERFHHLKMARAYENAYKKIIGGQPIQEHPPVADDWRERHS